MRNYTGIFFQDGKHMTWNFGSSNVFPNGINRNDEATVTIIGKYSDKDVSCLIVEWNGITNQPSGKLLHITTRCENGVSPSESGVRATKYGYQKVEQYQIKGVWK